jgi:hypothetical protein
MKKKKILFLGETYRADAITWMDGLRNLVVLKLLQELKRLVIVYTTEFKDFSNLNWLFLKSGK